MTDSDNLSGKMTVQRSRFYSLYNVFRLNAEAASGQNTIQALNDDPKVKVLIGGGSGFIGTELTKTLQRNGYRPVIVSRTPGASRITYDELKSSGIPKNTKAVVNLAGQNVLDFMYRWNDRFKALVYDSRVGTAMFFRDAIMNAEPKRRPKVFVQVTGVGGYPLRDDDHVYDEDSDHQVDENSYFQTLVRDWEGKAKLPPEMGVRNVFVRPGAVLGRNGGMIDNVYMFFALGLGGRMGSGNQYMPWIHVKDLAGIIVHSIENDKVEGVLNGVSPQIITNRMFVDTFAKVLSRPAFIPVIETEWNIIFGQERAAIVTKGVIVKPKRTLESGYKFRYGNIEDACKEFSAWNYVDQDDQ